jgi:hypothetical protein
MSTAAVAAAAAAARRMRQEEESMTAYTPADLAEGWEFKIVRSNTRIFRDPARLRQVLEEEARAGWVLLEKFDDSRIRLKRPTAARANDATLSLDAYRTRVGISDITLALTIMGCMFGVLGLVALIIATFAHR